jgi:hypothetical protein
VKLADVSPVLQGRSTGGAASRPRHLAAPPASLLGGYGPDDLDVPALLVEEVVGRAV